MKTFVLSLVIVSMVTPSSFGAGIEDSAVYKENPYQQKLIQIYWRQFERAMKVPHDSGDQIAANLLVMEAEADLFAAGLNEDKMAKLRSEVEHLYQGMQAEVILKVQDKLEKNETVTLLERIDVASNSEIQTGAQRALAKYPELLKTFEQLWTMAPGWAYSFRLYTGFLLAAAAQADGYNFSTPSGRASLDGVLRVVSLKIEGSGPRNTWKEFFKKVVLDRANLSFNLPRNLQRKLTKRWKEIVPPGKNQLSLKKSLFGPGKYPVWAMNLSGACIFAMVFTNIAYLQPYKIILVSIIGQAISYLAFISLHNALNSTNDRRSNGLRLLKKCGRMGFL